MKADTVGSLAGLVGKKGVMLCGNLHFAVEVHDVRRSFGRTDYLLSPVEGRGEQWVSSTNVTLD